MVVYMLEYVIIAQGLVLFLNLKLNKDIHTSMRILWGLFVNFYKAKGYKCNLKSNSQYVICVVEGTYNVCNSLIPLLNTHKELYF